VKERARSIVHVDLDPFFVSVERSLDPSLRGQPVAVAGGTDALAVIAAASSEARALGVRPGQTVKQARALCPGLVIRPGDLETYGRISDEVTSCLLGVSRRVERASADEAYLDLTEATDGRGPVARVEALKDQLQRRLGLDASLGLASTRLAARVASSWAKPRGFLLVLPGYEASFLAGRPITFLDLPPHVEAGLREVGLDTLGAIAEADDAALVAAVGPALAARVRAAAQGHDEEPIPVAAPPASLQEEATIRDRRTDAAGLAAVIDGLVRRAARRLRPFSLAAEQVSVEVRRPEATARRSVPLHPGTSDEDTLVAAAQGLAGPLLEAPQVRGLLVRLGKLRPEATQATLFPDFPQASGDGRR
jgi:DNA polymerase-4